MDKKIDLSKNKAMGNRVVRIRGRLSQTAFSNKIDTTQGNLSRIENGQIPSADILLCIARFGETTVEELLEGENKAKLKVDREASELVELSQSEIKKLRETVDAKDETIKSQRETIDTLKDRIAELTAAGTPVTSEVQRVAPLMRSAVRNFSKS